MGTPHDFDLLEWHATGQVALINVQTGTVTKVGKPTLVRSMDASPKGNYLRITRMTKPFPTSYRSAISVRLKRCGTPAGKS